MSKKLQFLFFSKKVAILKWLKIKFERTKVLEIITRIRKHFQFNADNRDQYIFRNCLQTYKTKQNLSIGRKSKIKIH